MYGASLRQTGPIAVMSSPAGWVGGCVEVGGCVVSGGCVVVVGGCVVSGGCVVTGGSYVQSFSPCDASCACRPSSQTTWKVTASATTLNKWLPPAGMSTPSTVAR